MGIRDGENNIQEYLIAGSVAGIVSRTCIAPVERIKILFQISKASTAAHGPGYMHYIPQIYRNEGVLAFWRGNSAAVIRVVPYMSITFLSYEEYKLALKKVIVHSNLTNLIAGSLAGVTAVIMTYPLDLVRARLAKQQAGLKSPKYRNMWDALIKIPLEKGRVTGDGKVRIGALYRGLLATLVGEAPYAGLKFCCYEAMKMALSDLWGIQEKDLSPMVRVSCGALSGLMAVNVVYPFDVVRRRMQTHEGGGLLYRSPFHAILQIVREEGITRGLYRGLTLNYIKTVPNVAIYMSLYDVVKNFLIKYKVTHDTRKDVS
uniref:Mitochondrial carrier protein n=1 Tax=Guillardia theta TaxID=55529 RepID=A0A7S4KQT8_GUITH|mmetsp:Transcript_29266/g.94016  ORF Transcript_29266/g.94016 Transcript_29266/m.94016 type:complete len:317 (+) Transcript_29266:109-1059(+)